MTIIPSKFDQSPHQIRFLNKLFHECQANDGKKINLMKQVKAPWLNICFLVITLLAIAGCQDRSGQSSRSLKEYSISRSLVSPAWVHKLIQYHSEGSVSEAPIDYDYDRSHKYLVFETSWGPLEEAKKYHTGHVPGAIHSDSDIYENGEPRWFLRPDTEIFAAMTRMGITSDTTVIVYSDKPIFATRLWWILKYAGLDDVRILDGGFKKWKADGFASETKLNHPVVAAVEYSGSVNSEFIATIEYAAAHYQDTDNYILADVRDKGEYHGNKSGYDYLIAKGRIPNSVWFYPVGGFSDRYFNSDNTFKSLDDIRFMWKELGLADGSSPNNFNKEVIFYCGGGYRSSSAFFYAYLMGYKNIRNLSHGWQGWSTTYTYDPSGDCSGGVNGTKYNTQISKYCQKPSGREIEPQK